MEPKGEKTKKEKKGKEKREGTSQRRSLKDRGLGGVDVIPQYPVSVTSNTEFLSNLFFTLTSLMRLAPEGR